MGFETVAVPAITEASFTAGLNAALPLVEAYQSELTGLHVVELCPVDYVPALYWHATAIADYDASVRAQAEKLESVFFDFCRDHRIDQVAIDAAGERRKRSGAWEEVTGHAHATLSMRARRFDVVIVGLDEDKGNAFRASLVGDLIMESGTPVLLAPDSKFPQPPEKIMIAWNGGVEAKRAVTMAEPFLKDAKEVQVVSFGVEKSAAPSAAEIARTLQRKGIPANGDDRPSVDGGPAAAIHDCADELGADLLVMGAYSHARWRQSVLGGLTQSIINNPRRAVFLAN